MLDLIARRASGNLQEIGQYAILCYETARSLVRERKYWAEILYQIYFIGVKSQSVVLITGAFTGMVLTAQSYFQFNRVQMETATLALVSVSMCSELGPVLTGLMVAGRAGAAMAAELGTMRVTEQIDALRTLATHPVDYLVAPRVLATCIALPLLTAESIVIGIMAGYLVAVYLLGVDPVYTWGNMVKYSWSHHVYSGLIKAAVFGLIIATVSSFKGVNCPQGAEGVGKATTEAVVASSICILISNFFLTMSVGRWLAP
jgi:phospholipid/cholesterol/gamma-HCH transport system permease protein